MAINPNPITPGTPISARAGAANGAAAGSIGARMNMFDDELLNLLVESLLNEDIYMDGVGNEVKKMIAEAVMREDFSGMTPELMSEFFKKAVEKQKAERVAMDLG